MQIVVSHFLLLLLGFSQASPVLVILVADTTFDKAIFKVILVLLSFLGPILKKISGYLKMYYRWMFYLCLFFFLMFRLCL